MTPKEPKWIELTGTVATTHALRAYGGFRFTVKQLDEIIAQINSGALPILGHHDRNQPVRTRNISAERRLMEDGEFEAYFRGEVVEADWIAIGEVHGFSVACGRRLPESLWHSVSERELLLAADAAWFTAEDVAAACATASAVGEVEGLEYFQFSAIPPAKIVIDLLPQLAIDLAANALSAAVVHLFRRRRIPTGTDPAAPTTVEIRQGDTLWILRTSDREVAKHAINALPQAPGAAPGSTPPSGPVRWEPDTLAGAWVAPD
ncbi:MAG TPA: hypothetical protein VFQ85_02745 [Mycobacteriales bacterium]|nr:hypothetical protein [Mycobacteriales bacterium]